MNENALFKAFGELDDDILERSEVPAARRKKPIIRKWGILAACIALAAGLAGAAFAAEEKEYSKAVEFFAENGLSTEGLSRSDVKAVYRDITTQQFTFDKTAEVLKHRVPGLEISQREPTPEELEELWNTNVWTPPQERPGFNYSIDYKYKPHESEDIEVLDKMILECYRDGALLWTAEFSDFSISDSVHTSAGTAVWGSDNIVWGGDNGWSRTLSAYSRLVRIDDNGNILWEREINHGQKSEIVFDVLDNGDGTWTVIGRADKNYLCLSQYDIDGNEISSCMTEMGMIFVSNAVRLGDGYLIKVLDAKNEDNPRLVKLDHEGNLIDSFTYEGEDCDYYITEMIEFGGRVYLSGYAVPKQKDVGGRYDVANILDYLFSRDDFDITSEELTPMVKDNYTAVLLLCDPEGGKPETFYSVKGSLGAELSVNSAGELEWNVNDIIGVGFSPYTGVASLFGTCRVVRYSFDTSGNLIGQVDTGETASYMR